MMVEEYFKETGRILKYDFVLLMLPPWRMPYSQGLLEDLLAVNHYPIFQIGVTIVHVGR